MVCFFARRAKNKPSEKYHYSGGPTRTKAPLFFTTYERLNCRYVNVKYPTSKISANENHWMA